MSNPECESCKPTTKRPESIDASLGGAAIPDECKTLYAETQKCMMESESTDWRVCQAQFKAYRACIKKQTTK